MGNTLECIVLEDDIRDYSKQITKRSVDVKTYFGSDFKFVDMSVILDNCSDREEMEVYVSKLCEYLLNKYQFHQNGKIICNQLPSDLPKPNLICDMWFKNKDPNKFKTLHELCKGQISEENTCPST